jgi:ribose/xylose/arabinose/galactoside ABC-type transport system permease subunit
MALDASADREHASIGSLLGQLLKKPSQEQIVLLLTLVLLMLFSVTVRDFSSIDNLLNLVRSISILGILGLGMGLIVISRGIDHRVHRCGHRHKVLSGVLIPVHAADTQFQSR